MSGVRGEQEKLFQKSWPTTRGVRRKGWPLAPSTIYHNTEPCLSSSSVLALNQATVQLFVAFSSLSRSGPSAP